MLETDPSTYITVCLVIYAPAGRPRPSSSQANSQAALGELTVVLGGHPQPLLVRDGDVRPIGTPGTVVGLLDEPQFRAERLTMCDGDTLVLYTDGLTDPPGDEGVSTDQLAELIRPAAAVELEQLADSIGEHSRTRRPHGGGDDTALLVVRFTADPAAFADALYATGASERQANGG